MNSSDGSVGVAAGTTTHTGGVEKPHLVALRGPLVVAHAESVRRDLMRALERHDTIVVDCSLATDADLSVVQLLISAERTAAAAGKTFRLERTSPAVVKAFEAGGFSLGALSGA